MRLSEYLKDKKKKWIVGAYIAGVVGVYTEPLFLLVYMIRQIARKRLVHRQFLLFLLLLLLHGVTMSFFTGYQLGKMFQQLLLLLIVYFGYIQLFSNSEAKLEEWFGIYMKISYIVSILGLIQFAFKLLLDINIFPYTLDFRNTQNALRVHSILLEAGHLALFLMPAVSYIIISKYFFINNKIKCTLILLTALLTFSSSMYVGVIIALIYRFYDRIKRLKIIFYIIGCILLYTVVTADYSESEYQEGASIKSASQKIIQTADAFSVLMSPDSSPEYFESFNLSTYALLSNFWVALNAPYRVIGTGLGTHEQNYVAKYNSNYIHYGFNKEDGYSLFIRLLSEFGYIGILLYSLFVIKSYNKRNVLSICFLILIISALIKGGVYTLNCLALFHILYYQCSKYMIDESLVINCLKRKKNV